MKKISFDTIVTVVAIISFIILTIIILKQGDIISIEQYNEITTKFMDIGFVILLIFLAILIYNGVFNEFPPKIIIILGMFIYILAFPLSLNTTTIKDIHVTQVDDMYLVESSNFDNFYTTKEGLTYANNNDNKFKMGYIIEEEYYIPSNQLVSEINNQK